MNQTTNYQLPQWEAGDTIKREDFNDLAARTDAALAGLQTAVEGAASFVTGSYWGDKTFPRNIELGFRPSAVLLFSMDGYANCAGSVYGGLFGSFGSLNGAAGITNTGFQLVGQHVNDYTKYYYLAFR